MRVLILGAGPAGLAVAERLRELEPAFERTTGDTIGITMISAEPFPPYSPPAMADYFLSGHETGLFWKGQDVCDRLGVHYRPGVSVKGIEPDRHRIGLEDGSRLDYDRLVIAMGGRLYAPLSGYDLPGVYNFKSLSAAQTLVEHVRRGEVSNALVVGAGFIGVEVALLLNGLGLEVTMIERETVMPRMLDGESAGIVEETLRDRGIGVRTRTTATAFCGQDRVDGVELESGDVARADVYVAATGVKPNIECLEGSGLAMDWGVQVDDTLATSSPDIWAAGDIAETRDRMTGERFVHAIFPNAVAQGRVVAERLLGFDTVYEGAESMNSLRHLGLPLIAMGAKTGDREIRFRRDGTLRKLIIDDGSIVGFRLAGDIRGAGLYRSLMLRGVKVENAGEDLLNPDFALDYTACAPLRSAA